MRTVFGLLFLAVAPCAWSAETWLKAETPDAVIYSDASAGDLQDFALRYAEFRHGFNEFIAPEGRRAPPSTILLFRKSETLRGFVSSVRKPAPATLTATTATVDFNSLFALALSGDLNVALITTFESDATWMLRRLGYFVPLWMAQGTGEVLAPTRVRGGQVVIGEQANWLTSHLKHGFLHWDRFFEMDQHSPEYRVQNGPGQGLYQAQAWALMHLVLLGGENPRERFQKLAGAVNGTKADLSAVAQFLGVTPEQIGEAVHSHVFQVHPQTRAYPLDVAELRAAIHTSSAPEAEVRVELGDLLQSTGNTAEAQVQYARASALAPNLPLVKEAKARSELAENDQSAAAQDYREAIAAGSTDPNAYLISAEDRLNDIGREGPGSAGEIATGAIDEIHQAMKLSPGNGAIYAQLARAYYLAGQISEANAEELTPALNDSEFGRIIRYYQALDYERLGLHGASLANLNFILADQNTPAALRESAVRALSRETGQKK